MDWKRYFIGIRKKDDDYEMFIGIGDLMSSGIRYTKKSGDKTFEIVNAVAKFLQKKYYKSRAETKVDKHYFGYNVKGVGKLVFIQKGYDFDVRKERKPEDIVLLPKS